MHVMATNICVWIKTLVYEILDAVKRDPDPFLNSTKQVVNVLKTEYGTMMGKPKEYVRPSVDRKPSSPPPLMRERPSNTVYHYFAPTNTILIRSL